VSERKYIVYQCGAVYLPADFHSLPEPQQKAVLEVGLYDLWGSVKHRIRVGTPDQIEDFYEHLAQVARVWLPGTDYLMLDADIARLLPHCADPMWIVPLCVGPASGCYESAERIEGVGVILKNRRGQFGPALPTVEPVEPLPAELYGERDRIQRDMEALTTMTQVQQGGEKP
jgi:hypothetical protein